MKVSRVTLRNFRNLREATFNPDGNLNFLVGSNGQGKTSFLEGLGFLSSLRSFRGAKSEEVIQFDARFAEVSCELLPDLSTKNGDNLWKTDLKVCFERSDPQQKRTTKAAFINGKPIKRSTQYLSQRFGSFELGFHSIVFNPSDHDLVRGDPGTRRSYLDRVLAAEDIQYLKVLQKYQRILEQRNAVLKNGDPSHRNLLHGFTEQLARYAAMIALARLEWINRLSLLLDNKSRQIALEQPTLHLVYLSSWVGIIEKICFKNNDLTSVHFTGQGYLPSLQQLEQVFWKKFSELEPAEWKSGHSLIGPHRDDWTFFRDNQVLKGHGSQGEVRTALLALKLAELELFQKKTGHRPLFLLDDFSSELDQSRRRFLLSFLTDSDLQVFVTTTDDSQVAGKRFFVMNGNLAEA